MRKFGAVLVAGLLGYIAAEEQTNFALKAADVTPNIYDNNAVDAQEQCSGYTAVGIDETDDGVTAVLQLNKECNVYGVDLDQLRLSVEYQTEDRLAVTIAPIKLTSENETYYDLPEEIVPRGYTEETGGLANSQLEFVHGNSPSFWFQVKRKDTGEVIFDTKGSKLVYENQFLEFKTSLPREHNLYGLGETVADFKLKPGMVRTMHNADIPDRVHANLYGTHPVYVEHRFANGKGLAHGVFLRNAHSQEILIGEEDLTWRLLGGAIELYFFNGPIPTQVVRQYQDVIGKPSMHQYWTLGHHHSRYGLPSAKRMEEIARKYQQAGIPLETMWSDLDHMDNNKDFTVDPEKYSKQEFGKVLADLHESHRYYVPLVDAAIQHGDMEYGTYARGTKNDVFVKNQDGSEFVGEVWPGSCVFPDWLGFQTHNWWLGELQQFREFVPYDGVWLDMNEVSSFCTAEECEHHVAVEDGPHGMFHNGTHASEPHVNARKLRYPPYAINNTASPNELGGHTMPMSAVHSSGIREYDWHNLFGHQICHNTYNALVNEVIPDKRPFLITRSTFPGTNSAAGHWGGDNFKEWRYLYYTITQGLSNSLYGFSMFGTDTCGFIGEQGDDFEELCGRWAQLGAFFSFYRNHNELNAPDQEYYLWDSVTEAAKTAMGVRYQLLPYMYTLLQNAHARGDTFLRALSWEFPNDPALAEVDRQFMVGGSIMVTPAIDQGVDKVNAHFPDESRWFDWYTHEEVATGEYEVDAPIGHIPVFIRGGSVLALQEPGLTTYESRQGEWTVLVAMDQDGKAQGELYLDDGESVQSKYARLSLSVENGHLKIKTEGWYQTPKLTKIVVLGNKKASTFRHAHGLESYTIEVDETEWVSGLDIEL